MEGARVPASSAIPPVPRTPLRLRILSPLIEPSMSNSRNGVTGSRLTRKRHRQVFPCGIYSLARNCHRPFPGGDNLPFAPPGVTGRWQPPPRPRRVGLRVEILEACSAFTRGTACTLAEASDDGPFPP